MANPSITDIYRNSIAPTTYNVVNATRNLLASNTKGTSGTGIASASGTSSSASKSSSSTNNQSQFMKDYEAYKKQQNSLMNNELDALNKARTDYITAQQNDLNAWRNQQDANQAADISKSNAAYDSAARQNYINYMNAQKNIGAQLNAQNIRGGASESSLIRLGSNYGTNVANNEAARNAALEAIRQNYAQQLADYESEYRNRLANYDENWNTNTRNTRSTFQDKISQAYSKAKENEQTHRQKTLDMYQQSVTNRYSTDKGWKNEIARLKKSNDMYKKEKLDLLRQAYSAWKKENKSSGSGGGGGGRSRSYSSGGGYSSGGNSTNSTDNDVTSAMAAYRKQNYNRNNMNRGTSTNNKKRVNSSSYYTGSYNYY